MNPLVQMILTALAKGIADAVANRDWGRVDRVVTILAPDEQMKGEIAQSIEDAKTFAKVAGMFDKPKGDE